MRTNPQHIQIESTSLYYATFAELTQDLDELNNYLNIDEFNRAERFKTAELTKNWSLARGLLKSLLADRLPITASDIKFQTTEHGKPILNNPESHHFNISHTNSAVLIGISTTCPIGVDMENIRIMKDAVGLAQQFFSKRESKFISSLDDPLRSKAFLDIWTFKEAYMKALGTGLKTPPSDIDIDCERLNDQYVKYSNHTLHRVAIDKSFTAAVCTREKEDRC